MTTAIIGFGAVGKALAGSFARRGLGVGVATTRPPEAIAAAAQAIGPTIAAKSLNDALAADTVLLAIPFAAHRDIAKALPSWEGKIVIDATNAYGVALSELGHRPSSVVVAEALRGARLVKAFNHLPAAILAQDPAVDGARRVIFLSGDDEGSVGTVATLVEQLGYAPVSLGKLEDGGRLVQAEEKTWAPLIFQDLFKREG